MAAASTAELAIVWKRVDFRESSRVVTLWSRRRGRFQVLAKGAHRPDSAVLGKLDFLNRVDVTLSGRGMPILGRTKLVHEPRALRLPTRFLVALYVAELFDRAMVAERPEPELFDLCDGGLTLIERAPLDRLPGVVAGLELRFLAAAGQLGDLQHCSQCGSEFGDADARAAPDGGLFCARHARTSGASVVAPPAVRRYFELLLETPGRKWPSLPPADREVWFALGLLARWVAAALDGAPRSRACALGALRPRDGFSSTIAVQ